MLVLVRAIAYAALFIGLLLVFVPARILAWSAIVRPAAIEGPQTADQAMVAKRMNSTRSSCPKTEDFKVSPY